MREVPYEGHDSHQRVCTGRHEHMTLHDVHLIMSAERSCASRATYSHCLGTCQITEQLQVDIDKLCHRSVTSTLRSATEPNRETHFPCFRRRAEADR
jgi:hypothetical protein